MESRSAEREQYDPQALIFEGILGFLQGAVLHVLADGHGTFDIARYKAAIILQTAEREVMGRSHPEAEFEFDRAFTVGGNCIDPPSKPVGP